MSNHVHATTGVFTRQADPFAHAEPSTLSAGEMFERCRAIVLKSRVMDDMSKTSPLAELGGYEGARASVAWGVTKGLLIPSPSSAHEIFQPTSSQTMNLEERLRQAEFAARQRGVSIQTDPSATLEERIAAVNMALSGQASTPPMTLEQRLKDAQARAEALGIAVDLTTCITLEDKLLAIQASIERHELEQTSGAAVASMSVEERGNLRAKVGHHLMLDPESDRLRGLSEALDAADAKQAAESELRKKAEELRLKQEAEGLPALQASYAAHASLLDSIGVHIGDDHEPPTDREALQADNQATADLMKQIGIRADFSTQQNRSAIVAFAETRAATLAQRQMAECGGSEPLQVGPGTGKLSEGPALTGRDRAKVYLTSQVSSQ